MLSESFPASSAFFPAFPFRFLSLGYSFLFSESSFNKEPIFSSLSEDINHNFFLSLLLSRVCFKGLYMVRDRGEGALAPVFTTKGLAQLSGGLGCMLIFKN